MNVNETNTWKCVTANLILIEFLPHEWSQRWRFNRCVTENRKNERINTLFIARETLDSCLAPNWRHVDVVTWCIYASFLCLLTFPLDEKIGFKLTFRPRQRQEECGNIPFKWQENFAFVGSHLCVCRMTSSSAVCKPASLHEKIYNYFPMTIFPKSRRRPLDFIFNSTLISHQARSCHFRLRQRKSISKVKRHFQLTKNMIFLLDFLLCNFAFWF